MNVGDLLSLLEGLNEDTEVRIMSQPSWPFEYGISNTVLASELDGFTPEDLKRVHEDEDDEAAYNRDIREPVFVDRSGEAADVLYLVEGTQLAYGTKDAWR